MGDLPRIELFARCKTEGWDIFGDEVDSDIELFKRGEEKKKRFNEEKTLFEMECSITANNCIYAIKRLNYKDESDTNMLFVAIRVLYSILFNMEK